MNVKFTMLRLISLLNISQFIELNLNIYLAVGVGFFCNERKKSRLANKNANIVAI